MSTADLREELNCSICLSIYIDPVTLRCGHNFCQKCIKDVLDTQDGSGVYTCPDCREEFMERPMLRKNTTLSNIAQHFMSVKPNLVVGCIYCTYCDLPVAAVKSCLQCKTSMCEKHLKKHNHSVEHMLVEPITKCPVHNKFLEYYCFQDSVPTCITCYQVGEHRGHQVELLDGAFKKKRETLRTIYRTLTLSRKETEERVQHLKQYHTEVTKKISAGAEKVMALFGDLRKQLDDLENQVLKEVAKQGDRLSVLVSNLIERLEIKMDELYSKMCYAEELSQVTDTVRVIQEEESEQGDFCCTKESEKEEGESYNKIVYDAGDLDIGLISELLHTGLSHIMTSANIWFYTMKPAELFLDVNTAGKHVHISHDFKRVSCSNIAQNLPKTSERFQYNQVLSTRSFSSGKHYWDVETSNFGWWMIGMSYPSIERTGDRSWIGNNQKSWSLCWFCAYSVSHDGKVIQLPSRMSCNKIRVYLDYEAGKLLFYELGDPIRHLYTFTATFTEPLHAALWVGWDGSSTDIWVKLKT
ncbi:E3 ubiquitin/ISG15 ligase TRIM25-like [Bufo gargarizans]|uniref:E3 ubiquitin/ISG15 ligase TRIM25-like n=1 Tax=Bufo gargarizans TaxID=30331 RepID=UPI001CF54A71|nr:E3 ubiquitin/ISG15 ligase TRIM25-like [Bufo gargarizans]XP_044140663.1 E3 ubiquitin/ISG15 ligase TRIM25-like [Bufo gargarizans]